MSDSPDQPLELSAARSGRRRFITLRPSWRRGEVTLEMPGDLPLEALMPDLLKALQWPELEAERPEGYRLRTDSDRFLDPSQTLNQAGVENAEVLWIERVEPGSEPDQESREGGPARSSGVAARAAREGPGLADLAGGPGDALEGARAPQLVLEEPSLVSRQGLVFVLGAPPIQVGRRSRGVQPDVDLTELDSEFAASRRHAEIYREQGHHVLVALKTTNGTFLDGAELHPGERRTLRGGEVIQFGFQGVELMYVRGGGGVPASYFEG